jgi:hypothetical protein
VVQPSGGKAQVLQEARETHVTGRGKAVQRGVTGRWLLFPSRVVRFLYAVYFKAELSDYETREVLIVPQIKLFVFFLGMQIPCVTQTNETQTSFLILINGH